MSTQQGSSEPEVQGSVEWGRGNTGAWEGKMSSAHWEGKGLEEQQQGAETG